MYALDFEVGRVYDRRRDIHARFGGQQQGGICTPANAPVIFLFTGESGESYGYRDGWDEDGVFHYTGEGQRGDMEFVRGNRAIRHDPKDLLVFESLGKSRGYRFRGVFSCAGYDTPQGVDVDGSLRQLIVFHLVPVDGEAEPPASRPDAPLDELRKRAYAAAKPAGASVAQEAKTTYRERSEAVRIYVLARAAGACEACGKRAPFSRPDGTPYLEAHHTRRLTDSGPDHPCSVGAICPNCHREIHFGAGGRDVNQLLQAKIEAAEQLLE